MAKAVWIQNGPVRLSVLSHGDVGTPLLFVPGTPAPASDFAGEMEALAPHRTLAVSLRGHAPSDMPESGYALEDFVADLAATVEQMGLLRPCLLGYSVATTYVLAYAATHPDQVSGLILVDYPARYPAMSPEMAERILANVPPEIFPPRVIRGIQRDSRTVELYPLISPIRCPVLILQGGQKGSRLNQEEMTKYQAALPQVEVVTLAEAGHDLRRADPVRFVGEIRRFLGRLG